MNDVTTQDGRVFYWLANIPYTREDGSETELGIWHSECAVCSASFTISIPVGNTTSNSFGRKHCNAHKLTKSQVSALWGARINAAKAANSAKKAR